MLGRIIDMSIRTYVKFLSIAVIFASFSGAAIAVSEDVSPRNACVESPDIVNAEVLVGREIISAANSESKLDPKTLEAAKKLVNECDGTVAYLLGMAYFNGKVVNQDLNEGERLLIKASSKGMVRA